METATFANRKFNTLQYILRKKRSFGSFQRSMFTVSECDLISNTLISHNSAPIRGRPTLKDAERFGTGSIIHESKTKQLPKIHKNLPKILYKK